MQLQEFWLGLQHTYIIALHDLFSYLISFNLRGELFIKHENLERNKCKNLLFFKILKGLWTKKKKRIDDTWLQKPTRYQWHTVPVFGRQVSSQTLNTFAKVPIHTQIVKTRRTTCHSDHYINNIYIIWFMKSSLHSCLIYKIVK